MIRVEQPEKKLSLFLLISSSFFLLLGKGIGHIFWDTPYHSLFWDSQLWGWLVERLTDMDWSAYVENLSIAAAISAGTQALGVFYVGMALILLTGKRGGLVNVMLGVSSVFLLVLAVLKFKDHGFQLGQLIELTIGWASPLLLLGVWNREGYDGKFVFFCKVCIALTFIGHGLYAVGFYPVPGKFIDMTISLLGVGEHGALMALRVFGVLDFIVAAMVFFPRTCPAALLYAAFWGLATALARILSNYYGPLGFESIMPFWHEMLFRLPHGLVPLALLFYLRNYQLQGGRR